MTYISVIIPVYNTEQYVRECLDSVITQSLSEIEIILIDDGSTDCSGKICDDYAENDERIRVLHTENLGLSAARNLGLEMATAKYVMFVDSDDKVSSKFCEIPYRLAEENDVDIVFFSYYINYRNGLQLHEVEYEEGVVSRTKAMDYLECGAMHLAWNKLYKRELFAMVRFPEGRVYEDLGTTYKLVHQARRVYCSLEPLYYHRTRRPGSITASSGREELLHCKYEFWEEKNVNLKKWGYNYQDNDIWKALTYLILFGNNEKHSREYGGLLRKTRTIPTCLTKKQKIMLRICRAFPGLFDYICVKTGKRM